MTEVLEKKLKWEKFELQFGTWARLIKPFFDKGGFEPIYAALKLRSSQNKIICPTSDNTFRAFRATPYEKLKCIIMGLCPYHSIINEGSGPVMLADGIAMSCGNHTKYKAPSLINLYDALEQEFEAGICLPCERPQSLQYLTDQGVLLTNCQLTVEVGKPGIHEDLWFEFTRYMCEEVYSLTGVPVLFLGQKAQYFSRFLAPMQMRFDVSHPASAAYKSTRWDSEKVFTKLQSVIQDQVKWGIEWLVEKPPF
jgi:uracil DNA glycosylase